MMKRWVSMLIFCCILACGPASSQPPAQENSPLGPENTIERMPGDLLFFSFGDWGTGSDSQKTVAALLEEFCLSQNCDFGLLLGDNFYLEGVDSVDDPLWDLYFEAVYSQLDLPFYAALGNHDHLGNPRAQIDYTSLQDRWTLPARQYSVSYPLNSPTPLLEIFVMDSTTYEEVDGDSLYQALKDSSATWKILALHHPLYSNGRHGDTGGPIQKHLLPLVCQEVDLVLSGHDHLFSHLWDAENGCRFHQVVVGTGGKDLYSSNPDPRALFSKSAFGFASLWVHRETLQIRFHEINQGVSYLYLLEK